MKLPKEFDLSVFTHSDKAKEKGIDNTPNEDQIVSLKNLWQELKNLEDYLQLCVPEVDPYIEITGAYRSKELLPFLAGASPTSRHCFGEAADTVCNGLTVERYFELVKLYHSEHRFVHLDQCIIEINLKGNKWVHIGTFYQQRCEFLKGTYYKDAEGKTKVKYIEV